MSYEQTWTFSHNLTPIDKTTATQVGKSFVFQLKNFLVANGWTVASSSNGTIANSSDNWSSLTDIVGAAAWPAHSWCVLKSPQGIVAGASGSYTGDQSRVWLLIELILAQAYAINLYFDRIAYTGGSTTNKPTGSAYENWLNGASVTTLNNTYYANTLFHFAAATNGTFAARTSYTGEGAVGFSLLCQRCVNEPVIASSGLPYPYGINLRAKSFIDSGTELIADITQSLNNYGWGYDGTAAKNEMLCLRSSTGVIGDTTGNSGNSYNLVNESSFGYMQCVSAGRRGMIGRIPDYKVTGANIANGTVNPGTIEYCFNGNVWMPSNVIISM
ncbi:hypothetical protein [Methylovulum sp.]|uniref:hypothetical protein n=1 Tax=Methylovulum sp. TaxID=1916980 RepID=UPI0026031161|nr:hypothetical protein [Methylovulum sp.]MDD5125799.1 hypothetical protein [Methylovulum sp.]